MRTILSGIYEIRNTRNGHRYIGSAVNVYKRWAGHTHHLKHGSHHCNHLQSAWDKYGAGSFAFSILEQCSKDKLIEREQFYLDTLRPEYNASPTAGTKYGWKMGQVVKDKIGKANKGNKAFLGHKHTQETKERMSAAQKGHPSNTRGVPRSQEVKEKISNANKGKKRSLEVSKKLSLLRKGNKNGSGNKGKTIPQYIREKMSIALKKSWAKRRNNGTDNTRDN